MAQKLMEVYGGAVKSYKTNPVHDQSRISSEIGTKYRSFSVRPVQKQTSRLSRPTTEQSADDSEYQIRRVMNSQTQGDPLETELTDMTVRS